MRGNGKDQTSTATDLRQLLGNVTPNKNSLQVDPEVLDNQPVLDDFRGVGQLLHPKLDLFLEGSIVPTHGQTVTNQTLTYTFASCNYTFFLATIHQSFVVSGGGGGSLLADKIISTRV